MAPGLGCDQYPIIYFLRDGFRDVFWDLCLGDFVCFGFQENEIRVLNINGPRESSVPGIHDKSHLVATKRSCSDLQQRRKSIFFDPGINSNDRSTKNLD